MADAEALVPRVLELLAALVLGTAAPAAVGDAGRAIEALLTELVRGTAPGSLWKTGDTTNAQHAPQPLPAGALG